MSLEYLNRLDDISFPFTGKLDAEDEKYLKALLLGADSSAEDVRRTAISLRRKFENDGLDALTVRALRWSLKKTKDTLDDAEFLQFLVNDTPFEQIEADRFDFR
jgi:hypothetical protein